MLNYGTGETLDEARDMKELYHRVLDALVAALEAGDRARLAAPSAMDRDGRTLCWVYDGAARCPDCDGSLWIFVPDAEGVTTTLQFCPNTWDLKVLDADGQTIAAASRRMEAILRSLPPGCTVIGMKFGDVEIPFDPPYVTGCRDRGKPS